MDIQTRTALQVLGAATKHLNSKKRDRVIDANALRREAEKIDWRSLHDRVGRMEALIAKHEVAV